VTDESGTVVGEDEQRDRPLRRFRERLRAGGRRGGGTVSSTPTAACEHLAAVQELPVPEDTSCQLHGPDDGPVVHHRMCLSCGITACCDSSPAQHMTAHFHAEGHPVMRSVEPGESWRWCYVDEVLD
jgi:CPA1 family monovalent cation:H+ antiporter